MPKYEEIEIHIGRADFILEVKDERESCSHVWRNPDAVTLNDRCTLCDMTLAEVSGYHPANRSK